MRVIAATSAEGQGRVGADGTAQPDDAGPQLTATNGRLTTANPEISARFANAGPNPAAR